MDLFSILPTAFGWLLNVIYQFVGNYGLALIIFTIITRALTMPLSIKSIKYTQSLNEIQPELNRIQERFKNDRERLAQEQMKLYKEKGISPTGGCLPSILQLVITFSLFYAIIEPLRYQFGLPMEQINELIAKLPQDTVAYRQLKVAIDGTLMNGIGLNPLNMWFLGLDLGMTPTLNIQSFKDAVMLIFPIVSTGLTYLSMRFSMMRANNKNNGDKKSEMPQMNKTMMWISPIMTLYFSFIVPAGLSLYWALGNLIQIIQQIVINKKYVKKAKELN